MRRRLFLATVLGMPVVLAGHVGRIVAALQAHQRRWRRSIQAYDDTDVYEDAAEM